MGNPSLVLPACPAPRRLSRHRLPRLLNWKSPLDLLPAGGYSHPGFPGLGSLLCEPFQSSLAVRGQKPPFVALQQPRLTRGCGEASRHRPARLWPQTEQVWLKNRPGRTHYLRATLFCKQGHRGRDSSEGTPLLIAATAATTSSSFA